MCGKFTHLSSWQEVHAFSQPLVVTNGTGEVVVSTPMRFANIMWLNAAGARELVPMRWGFAGKDDANPARPKHMHARAETVDRLPTFAQAFASSRGILMVHTFNEGEELPNGKTKQWVITPQDAARWPTHSYRRDLRGVAQRRGNAADLRAGDDTSEHAHLPHHGSHACDPAA